MKENNPNQSHNKTAQVKADKYPTSHFSPSHFIHSDIHICTHTHTNHLKHSINITIKQTFLKHQNTKNTQEGVYHLATNICR